MNCLVYKRSVSVSTNVSFAPQTKTILFSVRVEYGTQIITYYITYITWFWNQRIWTVSLKMTQSDHQNNYKLINSWQLLDNSSLWKKNTKSLKCPLKVPYYTVFHQFHTAIRGPTALYSICIGPNPSMVPERKPLTLTIACANVYGGFIAMTRRDFFVQPYHFDPESDPEGEASGEVHTLWLLQDVSEWSVCVNNDSLLVCIVTVTTI